MGMKRGKGDEPEKPPDVMFPTKGIQCQECGTFYQSPNPANAHVKGWIGWEPGQLVRRTEISHGICSEGCGSMMGKRYAHSKVNKRLVAEGHDPEPLPDEYKHPWEISGKPENYDGPWPPEGWDEDGNRIVQNEAGQVPPAE